MNLINANIRSVVIFRALQLGDLLCSVPAFRALRTALPNAHIVILGMPWMKSFVERFNKYLDEFIRFPGYPGLPEQPVDPAATISFLSNIQGRKFDLALQMQGNGSIVNPMIGLFGTMYSAGFYRKEDYYPGEGFLEYPEGKSEVHRHLMLMQHIGIDAADDELEFPVSVHDNNDLKKASLPLNGQPYICVHPGSRGSWRQWPTANFAMLADQSSSLGYTIVLTGTSDEMTIVNDVAAKMKTKPVIAAGRTNLGAMAALLQNSAGLISNCTGVSHIASALKKKSVIISMDGEPERWRPLNKNLHHTIDWTRNPDISLAADAVNDLFGDGA